MISIFSIVEADHHRRPAQIRKDRLSLKHLAEAFGNLLTEGHTLLFVQRLSAFRSL